MKSVSSTVAILATLICLFSSCSSVMYLGESSSDMAVYSVDSRKSFVVTTVPSGSTVLVLKKRRKYRFVAFQNHQGYIYGSKLKDYRPFTSSDGPVYGFSTHYRGSGKKPQVRMSQSVSKYNSHTATTAAPKSSYIPGNGAPVQVKGYYRKDGTYVRPHTRKAPTRRH